MFCCLPEQFVCVPLFVCLAKCQALQLFHHLLAQPFYQYIISPHWATGTSLSFICISSTLSVPAAGRDDGSHVPKLAASDLQSSLSIPLNPLLPSFFVVYSEKTTVHLLTLLSLVLLFIGFHKQCFCIFHSSLCSFINSLVDHITLLL